MTLQRFFERSPPRAVCLFFVAALLVTSGCKRTAEQHFRAAQDARYRGNAAAALVEYRLAREAALGDQSPQAERLKTRALWEAADACYAELKEPAQAAALYRDLVNERPDAPEVLPARVKLAEILRSDLNDLPEAIYQLAAAIALQPSAALHYDLAKLYFATGDYGACATECDAILQRYASSSLAARAALLEAQALQMIDGRSSEAIQLLERLVAQFPSLELKALALHELGRMQSEAGDLEAAIEHLVRALKTHPNPSIVQSAIASARRRLGMEAGAGDRVAEMILANAVFDGLSTLREEAASDER